MDSSPVNLSPVNGSDQPDTIPAVLLAAARDQGTVEAVVDGETRLTFEQLRDQSLAVTKALMAAGIQPGDRVALWAPNEHRWLVTALGVTGAGAVLVPLNTRYRAAEARDIVCRSGAKLVLLRDGFLGNGYLSMLRGESGLSWSEAGLPEPLDVVTLDAHEVRDATSWDAFLGSGQVVPTEDALARWRSVTGDQPADILYTSGTTGRPKGAVCTHEQDVRTYRAWSDRTGLRPGDRYLIVNPLFHTFGYKAGVLACLLRGATMVLQQTFDVGQTLQIVERERITVLPGPPTIYVSLLDAPGRPAHDLSSLRLAVTGAADVPITLVRRLRAELFPQVLTAYGLTETCGTVTACSLGDDDATVAHTSGAPIDGVEIRVVGAAGGDGDGGVAGPGDDECDLEPGSDGEVLVRGYNVMIGYLDDADATAAAMTNGWLRTGDIGRVDAAGNLTITGRCKDMFTVGGFNVYPAEVEQVISEHPAVSECAVVGAADPRMGEVGHAFVVARPGAAVPGDELIEHCRDRLANFKVPRRVTVVGELPRNAAGKVDKLQLADLIR